MSTKETAKAQVIDCEACKSVMKSTADYGTVIHCSLCGRSFMQTAVYLSTTSNRNDH